LRLYLLARVGAALLLLAIPHDLTEPPIRFREIATKAGLTTVPQSSAEKRYIVEMMGGGIALFDCDDDGKLDIVVVRDSTVESYLNGGDLMVTLYHQDSELRFTDITQSAGLTTRGWGMGVAVGDYDNDGLPDLYVTGYGHNVLYHNLGGCKFEDVTESAHVRGGGFSVGAAWADYDRDGHLDLFVSRYVNSDIHNLPQPGAKSFYYRGVSMEVPVMDGETDLLYHNRGDGTFEELAEKAGVGNPDKRLGMGAVWGDYDDDGWPDLFVTNDMGPNFLYRNKHDGTFEDVGLFSGTALSLEGKQMGNMAADFADYDHDGRLDLLVTRYGYQPMTLFRNLGARGFADVTRASKIGSVKDLPVRWGGGFADFDNDGWPDLFVANGNVTQLVDSIPNELKYREPLQLFCNRGNQTFAEIADAAGLNNGELQSRRGTAFGDLNNDGSVDVVVYNMGGPPSLFLNVSRNANHRVLFRLIGRKSNRSAIGARVTVQTAAMTQLDEVRGGGSYLSSNDQRLHFGLAADSILRHVTIAWPSGHTEELKDVPADAIYTIVEGQGIKSTVKLRTPANPADAGHQ
jgi:enediyne biosynthesis protein E4